MGVISRGDDFKRVSQLLCEGAPLTPVGDCPTHAFVLAVTLNRPRILSLLLTKGEGFTTTSHGRNILQMAWRSPDVTSHVQAVITNVSHYLLYATIIQYFVINFCQILVNYE